jgi:signal transduction histidine kinase
MRLVAFRVDGETQSPEGAIVPADHRVVEIEFAAGALRDPRRVRYRIRLDGVEWIDTHEPVFRLAGIAPGEHEVEAAASLDGLLWSPPSEFRFRVRPPWYARGWLIALGATVLVSAGIVAHRLRTRHLVDLERQRVRIAMDLHDELGAGLGSLGILGGVMADGSAPAEERQKLGELVAQTAGELGGALHDIVYSLRTGEARLDSLAEQLRVRGQTLFAGNGVRFNASANRPPIRTVAPSVGRHVYRIAIEALHNAARHAGASHVGLGIEPVGRNGRIRVWVEDDGRGIEPTTLAEPGGMGLVTMRRRAEALGGELTIDSKPGRGTRIELSFDALGRRGPRVRWRRRRNVPNRRLSDGPSK